MYADINNNVMYNNLPLPAVVGDEDGVGALRFLSRALLLGSPAAYIKHYNVMHNKVVKK